MKRNKLINGLFLAAAALALTFTSCKKETQDTSDDVASTQAILVESASVSGDAVYIVNTTPDGATRDSIAATDLPASVSTYLAANYSGYTLKKTFKVSVSGSVNSYIVVILYNNKPVGLKFDSTGAFVRVFEQRERGDLRGKGWKRGGRFDGREGAHHDTIAVSSLSTVIKAYFLVNYPTDTLVSAFKGKDSSTVVISSNNGLYATAFSSANLFLKRAQIIAHKGKKTAVAQTELPATTLTYLTTTYPGYVFDKAFAVKINSTIQAYVVIINSNNTRIGLQFNATGDFVKTVVIR
ncbi:PepSY-like domain-containing protein [Desertivirga arenae]|uniref:PepSY-like domain-containing protein n=1 Tax=Desertivirga arenae TaxID=2810309 RepID=UPI001A9765C1|nr:PepSY-like domain-containing protein [Pedobacter sp. SYSU D00823]